MNKLHGNLETVKSFGLEIGTRYDVETKRDVRTGVAYLLVAGGTRWSGMEQEWVPTIRYQLISMAQARAILAAMVTLHGELTRENEMQVSWPATAVAWPVATDAGDALAAGLFAGERVSTAVEVR